MTLDPGFLRTHWTNIVCGVGASWQELGFDSGGRLAGLAHGCLLPLIDIQLFDVPNLVQCGSRALLYDEMDLSSLDRCFL
jgi:hypothetical protein